MKKILLILILFSVTFSSCAQRNFVAKKLLFQQVQKPYINYGLLYNWYAVTDARNICNVGFHMPTASELTVLRNYIGYPTATGYKLRGTGIVYWDYPNTTATNEMLFNGRGAGVRSLDGPYSQLNAYLYIISPTLNGTGFYYGRVHGSTDEFLVYYGFDKRTGVSARPVKDSTILTHGQSGTYTGNDGKVYRTICIGTQEWVADNLAETKYQNGDWVTGFDGGTYTPISNAAWTVLTTEACCVFNDDLNNQ